MPKVRYTAAKGLYQESGTGVNMEVLGSSTGHVAKTTTSAPTQLANGSSATLVPNTHYLAPADGNACALVMPTNASSKVGDVIVIDWNVAVGNGQLQTIGLDGQDFAVGSNLYKPGGVEINAVDVSAASDDFLWLDGLTDCGPGIGTRVVLSFNGEAWWVEARVTKAGAGSATNADIKFHTAAS